MEGVATLEQMTRQDYERMSRLEVEIESLKELVMKIDAKLDVYASAYVPRQEFSEVIRSRDERISHTHEELQDFKSEYKEDTRAAKSLNISYISTFIAAISLVATIVALIKGG